MKVLVTGGTGFVGSHAVAALLRAGHQVRLLARSRTRLAPALVPHGIDVARVEVVEGNVVDEACVASALRGCEGVLHAASVYAFRGHRDKLAELRRTNVAGTRTVLSLAAREGLNPILHVSSIAALMGRRNRKRTLTAETPLGDPYGDYLRSKRDSERVAREMQAQGLPVVIVQPGMIWGPHDPHLGESAQMALAIARGQSPLTVTGGLGVVDVRDVAQVCAAAMKPASAPRIYPAYGEYIRHCDIHSVASRAAGMARLNLPSPTPLAILTGFPVYWLLETLGVPLVPTEGLYFLWCDCPVDNGATERELGVGFRPSRDAIRDMMAWLMEAGHLPKRPPLAS